MKYLFLLLFLVLFSPLPSSATELIDHLDKTFKTIGYPEEEVIARITIKTAMYEAKGERIEETWLQSMKVHRKLLVSMKEKGWKPEDPLQVDTIDAGEIQLETGRGMNLRLKETFRLKAFLSPCDNRMVKYRGGSVEKFFKDTVIKKAERCFTYEEHLQGENYPY